MPGGARAETQPAATSSSSSSSSAGRRRGGGGRRRPDILAILRVTSTVLIACSAATVPCLVVICVHRSCVIFAKQKVVLFLSIFWREDRF
jgi:hypothetical protein